MILLRFKIFMVFIFFIIIFTSTIFIIILLINFSTIIIISRPSPAIIRIKSWSLSSYEWWINTSIPLRIRLILRISSFYFFIIIGFIYLSQKRTSWLSLSSLCNQILNFFIFAVSPWPIRVPGRGTIRLPMHLNIFLVDFIGIKIIMIILFFQRSFIIFVLIVIVFIHLSSSNVILINGTLWFLSTRLTASDVFGVVRELFIISPLMFSPPS